MALSAVYAAQSSVFRDRYLGQVSEDKSSQKQCKKRHQHFSSIQKLGMSTNEEEKFNRRYPGVLKIPVKEQAAKSRMVLSWLSLNPLRHRSWTKGTWLTSCYGPCQVETYKGNGIYQVRYSWSSSSYLSQSSLREEISCTVLSFSKSSRSFQLTLTPSESLSSIFRRIQRRFGISAEEVSLSHNGKPLLNSDDIRVLNIASLCTFSPTILFVLKSPPLFEFGSSSTGSGLHLSKSNTSVRCTTQDKWWTALICPEISHGVHEWSVRLDRCKKGHLFIGVSGKNHPSMLNTWIGSSAHSWGLLGGGSLWTDRTRQRCFGRKLRSGDVINVKLDMDNRTMSFSINLGEMEIAFTDLPSPLYPAISIYTFRDKVTIKHVDK